MTQIRRIGRKRTAPTDIDLNKDKKDALGEGVFHIIHYII